MRWLLLLLLPFRGIALTPDHSNNIYCSGEAIGLVKDLPESTVNHWMWDVCLLTPVDPDAVVSAEYGHFDGTDFSSAITNHGDAPIQVRFQIFVSKDEGTHYAAPEIFIVTIQPEITQLTVVGNCGGNQNLVGQLHAQTNLTINGNVTYRWFQTSPTAPNGITLLEGQGENIFQISSLDEGRYGVEVKNEGCQPAPYYFYHRPGDLAWSTTPAMSNENIYFTGSNPRIEEAEFDHCNLYFFGFTNTATNVPGGEVLGQFLRVSENGSLNMSYSTASSACENMWGGILMEEGAQIEATNSTIKDARWAVDADGVTASCLMTACTLANNLNGVRLNHWISEGFSFTENIVTSNYLEMKRPYDYHTNSSINGLGLQARCITQKGLQLGYFSNFVSESLSGNVFENCLIGLETGIRTSGSGPAVTVDHNHFINCTWKGANTAGYGIDFSHCWFGFPTDLSWVNTWQSQTFRGLTFGPNQEQQKVFGIFNHNGGAAAGLGTVSDCNFYSAALQGTGDPLFIGAMADKASDFSGNTFEHLSSGIVMEAQEDHSLSIQSNKFTDKGIGVELKANENNTTVPVINFLLRCNNFEQTTPIPTGNTHFGLVIGENASLFLNKIGGDNGTTVSGSPNANRWPLNSLTWNSIITPTTIDGFVSIWNQTDDIIEYWRYNNEFYGEISNTNGGSIVPKILSPTIVYYVYSAVDLCQMSGNNCDLGTDPSNLAPCVASIQANIPCSGFTLPTTGFNWTRACEESPVDFVEWPFFARPTQPNGEVLSNSGTVEIKPDLQLGQSQPNPGKTTIEIPFFLPEASGKTELWITDVSTGRLVESRLVNGIGGGKLEVNLSGYSSGIYAYKLIPEKGKASQTMKFVVIR